MFRPVGIIRAFPPKNMDLPREIRGVNIKYLLQCMSGRRGGELFCVQEVARNDFF
jgi:hypothetical protein